MSNAVFLGIDIGTSGIRGSCIDENSKEIICRKVSFEAQPTSPEGQNEQNPNIWLQQLDRLISEISQSLNSTTAQNQKALYRIKSIAIDGTSSTLIACDENGTAISKALMYNDQQSLSEAEDIRQFAPPDSAVHGASSSLAKALFLLKKSPNTKTFCHQANWLAGSLTGQYKIADENNCLKMGYDSVKQAWPKWINKNKLNAVIPTNLLPRVVPPGTPIGKIKKTLIVKYQLDASCFMVAGTTDSNAAVLATGANQIGDAVTSLGSTLVIKLFSDKPIFNSRYGIYSHRLNGNWLVGGASNSGCSVLLQHFTQQQINDLSLQIKPNKLTGLDYYPLPAKGERFPINDSNKLSEIQPRPDSDTIFFQGLLEGISNIEAEGYKKLASLGATKPLRIFTAGGGSVNTSWSQIRERISNTKVVTAAQTEASYGSALLALQGYKQMSKQTT